jgi:hypothetical protein
MNISEILHAFHRNNYLNSHVDKIYLGRCSPESVNFNDPAMGGVVRAGLKNFKLCLLLDILLYFEEIKHLVRGGGRAVGPRGRSFFWTLTEISPESVNFQREDC